MERMQQRCAEKATGQGELSQVAADHLATLTSRAVQLLNHLHQKHINADGTLRIRIMVQPNGAPCDSKDVACNSAVDISCAVIRLLSKHLRHHHYPGADLRVSEYVNDRDDVLAVNEDKGKHLRVCVFEKKRRVSGTPPEDINTLMRVLLHELAHSMHCEYVRGKDHGRHFKRLETYLLYEARRIGVYECPPSRSGQLRVCGRLLPLTALCKQSRGTRRKPSSAAEVQDRAPQSAESMQPHVLAEQCSTSCSAASRVLNIVKSVAS